MESPADDYRIQSFDLDTQMLLKTALKGQQVTVLLFQSQNQIHVPKCL